ncbi:MAG: DUF5518 domain-containing protein, partial [Methanobacterium sp.]
KPVIIGFIVALILGMILVLITPQYGSLIGMVIGGIVTGYLVNLDIKNGAIHGALIGVIAGIILAIFALIGYFIIITGIGGDAGAEFGLFSISVIIISVAVDAVLGAFGGIIGFVIKDRRTSKTY